MYVYKFHETKRPSNCKSRCVSDQGCKWHNQEHKSSWIIKKSLHILSSGVHLMLSYIIHTSKRMAASLKTGRNLFCLLELVAALDSRLQSSY